MRPEILAPAGSMSALKAAVHAGADAVYLGGDKFGARAYAGNFDNAALIEAIEYCHLYGVKVYLTINTLFRNEEVEELTSYLVPLYEAGLDAVIVQDLGVMKYVHLVFPDLEIHASTQMTITTKYAYELLKEYGVTRIVPARELSLEEIASLKDGTDVPEVEVFVQGALCYCYSGQCLMSSMLGGRSGNRGRCAQTCRLPYTLYEENGKQVKTKGDYLLSPKDLCGLEAIPDLIQAGVDSFKIEGRMKRPEYVAVCVRAYRGIVDAWYNGTFSMDMIQLHKEQMAEVFNRGGFTKGYYHSKNGKDMMSIKNPGNIGVGIGRILSIQKNKLTIQLEQDVYKGDVLMPKGCMESIMLTNNVDGYKGQRIVLNAPKSQHLYVGQTIQRMSKAPLIQELESYVSEEKKVPLQGSLHLETGEQATFMVKLEFDGHVYSGMVSGDVVELATNKPLTEETVTEKIGKTGGTRYYFESLQIHMSENGFYPLKALKELRRCAIAALETEILASFRREWKELTLGLPKFSEKCNDEKHTVMVSSEEQYDIVKQYDMWDAIYIDMQYFNQKQLMALIDVEASERIIFALPPILRYRYEKEIKEWIGILNEQVHSAILIRNIDELALIKHYGFTGNVVADYSLYAMNDWAADFLREIISDITLTIPVELNAKQIGGLRYKWDNSEIVVYGYQQLMVSQQCLEQTTRQCSGTNPHFIMKDRYFKNFFIFSVCKYCYNLIYNGFPTVLYDIVDKSLGEGISKRLHFTKEDSNEVETVLQAYTQGKTLEVEKTRGHYKRGVE